MLTVKTPLLQFSTEMLGQAVAGVRDGTLEPAEARELNNRAAALIKIVRVAVQYQLADVLACQSLAELEALAPKYAKLLGPLRS